MDNPSRPSPPLLPPCQPAGEVPALLPKGEHPISRRNIDPDVFKIINRLYGQGFTAYLVGGAVRDMMLGRTPVDFDLVTDARPGQIKKLFSNAYLIGRRFRLAHIHFHGGKYIEVATFRKLMPPVLEPEPMPLAAEQKPAAQAAADGTPGEPPPAFHDIYGTPREDAFRRDLTINALFFDVISSTVIDYVGGLEDLRNRIVRVIGDPAERFVEDPVRIWRTIRHAARLGFTIDGSTEQLIPVFSHLIAKCPGARLYEELNNDLESRTQPVLGALRRHALLPHILGRMGEDYESDPALYARVDRLFEIKDRAQVAGAALSRDEVYTLLFMPWAQRLIAGSKGDIAKLLKDAVLDARFQASVPRNLRAEVIQILMIVDQMVSALRTGRMRWALKRRAHFAQASRVCIMAEKGRLPEPDESFEDLYRQAFPAGSAPREGHRRRRRRRRHPGAPPSDH
jgi:poly(A) polymerase